jgi:hypothetical protein
MGDTTHLNWDEVLKKLAGNKTSIWRSPARREGRRFVRRPGHHVLRLQTHPIVPPISAVKVH